MGTARHAERSCFDDSSGRVSETNVVLTLTKIGDRKIVSLRKGIFIHMKIPSKFIIVAIAFSLTSGAIQAGPLLTSPGTGTLRTDGGFTVGYGFVVGPVDLMVSKLGIYDYQSNGLLVAHDVGLWTSGGALLGSVTVSSGLSGELIGEFRYTDLSSPIVLTSGSSYILGAFYSATGGEPFRDRSDTSNKWPTMNSIYATFFQSGNTSWALLDANALGVPTYGPFGGNGFIGPNLYIAVVPEPSSLALLLAGATAMGLLIRRRSAFS